MDYDTTFVSRVWISLLTTSNLHQPHSQNHQDDRSEDLIHFHHSLLVDQLSIFQHISDHLDLLSSVGMELQQSDPQLIWDRRVSHCCVHATQSVFASLRELT